jgi:hypothetical protein
MSPLRPEKRQRFERELTARFSAITNPLGYELGPTIPRGREHLGLWFFRRGSGFFVSEVIAFRILWTPGPRFVVDFWGSRLTPEELLAQGLSGNAGGWNLFRYQVSVAGRTPKELLPQEILLGPEEEWPNLFARLQREISWADSKLWPELAKAWAENEEEENDEED